MNNRALLDRLCHTNKKKYIVYTLDGFNISIIFNDSKVFELNTCIDIWIMLMAYESG